MRATENVVPRWAAVVLLVAAFAFVAFMTLRPTPSVVESPVLCIFCGSLGGVDFILNVVLFVPIGMTVRWAMGRWMNVVVVGFVTTLIIETLQWRIIPGRDASLGDIVANTLGTLVGAWLAVAVFDWLKAGSVEARRYARVCGIASSLVVVASAVLVQPLVPRYPLWVQWKPIRAMTDPFEGQLARVEVKGRSVHGSESFRSNEAFDATHRSIIVTARIEAPSPAPSRRSAIIVRTANGLEEGFSLSQWRDAATFRSHIVADRLRLRSILVGLDSAFSGPIPEQGSTTFAIVAESSPAEITLQRLAADHRVVSLRRTIGVAWALLLPWDVALSPRWLLANSVWLAALVIPVSFFVTRVVKGSDRSAGKLFWWPLLLVVAVMAATPVTGLSSLGMVEWAGVLAGTAAGRLLEGWWRVPN